MMLLNNAFSLVPMGALMLYFGEHHQWSRFRNLTTSDTVRPSLINE